MKFKNEDLIKITEIKQFFLQPPYTFKLAAEAQKNVIEVRTILEDYEGVPENFFEKLKEEEAKIQTGLTRDKLMKPLIEIGRLLGGLTNR